MVSERELKNSFSQFKKAFERLKEAVEIKEENEIKRDAVIQRFEFTYELLWKTLKRIARQERIETFSPKSAFTAAFNMGLIKNEKLFVNIIDARNKTTHVYSEKEAEIIYKFVKEKVIFAFEEIEANVAGYLKK